MTEILIKGEGGAGAGSFTDVVATGVVNGLEDCEGAGIDEDGVFSDAAHGSGTVDRTLAQAPSTARDSVRLSWSMLSNTSRQLSIVLTTRGYRRRLG